MRPEEIVKELIKLLETYAETSLETIYNNRPEFCKEARKLTKERYNMSRLYTYEEMRSLINGSSSVYAEVQISYKRHVQVELDKAHLLTQLSATHNNWTENKDDKIFEATVKGTSMYIGVQQ